MRKIEPPDSHHLSSAIGWLELGDHCEADSELKRIHPGLRVHPDVMEVRWQVYSQAKWWEACVDLANTLIKLAPDRTSGYIYRAYSLRRCKGLMSAWMSLLPAIERFPDEWLIPYNLSCYSCQLGNLDAARRWLAKALERGEKAKLKSLALEDPDLKPLQPEIRQL
jgi:hypothetical protein